MAGETIITVSGNLTADPELRYTSSGKAVSNFTIASTPRNFDKQSNEWKDGDTLFLRCTVWGDFAEHVSSSLVKGTRVITQGRLKMRKFQDRDGNNRESLELDVEDLGPSLVRATAQVVRASGKGAGEAAPAVEWPTTQTESWSAGDETPF